MKPFHRYLALTLLIALISCEDGMKEQVTDYGVDYFPLTTGWYAIYDVEKTIYSELSLPEELVFELKTEIVDSFLNNAGGYTFVIYNSRRANDTEPWAYFETLSVRISNNELVVTEESTPFVKLSFPVGLESVWNGNRRNNLGDDQYRISAFDQPATINGIDYKKTLTVEQELYDDKVTMTDERIEVYARGVGLISRDIRQLVYCTEQVCMNDKIIQSGIVLTQRIKDYGVK